MTHYFEDYLVDEMKYTYRFNENGTVAEILSVKAYGTTRYRITY